MGSGERRALSVKELANAYGVSPGLIRLEIDRKRLRVTRIGRRVVIPIEAVAEWLDASLIPALPGREKR
jgi:excisionase family DNA binding protein